MVRQLERALYGPQALAALGRAPLVHELRPPPADALSAMFRGVALALACAPAPPAEHPPVTPLPAVAPQATCLEARN